MASVGDKLYMIYSQYDANWNQVISFISYDAINEKVISDNFITDGTSIDKPYKIGADPTTTVIFILLLPIIRRMAMCMHLMRVVRSYSSLKLV